MGVNKKSVGFAFGSVGIFFVLIFVISTVFKSHAQGVASDLDLIIRAGIGILGLIMVSIASSLV